MWLYDTTVGTFCIRYMREGYGLFLNGVHLNWQKDAKSVAELVRQGKTGHAPWDTLEGVRRPGDLSEWRCQEPNASPVTPNDDPLVIPLECACGHEFGESVARLRSIQELRCPACKARVALDRERLLKLIQEAREKRSRAGRR